ncbi:MAG: hypothetical protein IPH93_12330 [Saprospiraceae bacterium]|nr:hypothetical protein [Saprospiraceae bacterium]MBK7812732.1 hypothetical protein [Saprospiraceae bacterium]MBK9630923.1 hypothetical protein [Saprospiraceae bacterium]
MLKKIKYSLILIFILFNLRIGFAQDSTGLAGDHFSLESALQMFKIAESPEDFEKLINDEKNKVTNLDLNQDGDVDFVRVNEFQEDDVRIFVLSVDISETESQDIAVIELEKNGDESAVIQIVGDEEIFGEALIVEPSDPDDHMMDKEESKGNGPSALEEDRIIVVNVWGWPCVRRVYTYGYRPWRPNWRWSNYPTYWAPRRPWGWAVWHPFRHVHVGPHVRYIHTRRCVSAPRIYAPHHRKSVVVKTRYAPAHKHYKVTKSKTTVKGPRGNKVTKSKTTVKGPRGNKVTKSKTTVKRSSPRKK